ncbi:MBOAT family O-acyltransferase [Usitatibacter palustris]|uniref:Probable alginate O-acetylase AlgI n=1 Tax=Usitatibacter palustris TaxID=2732487 RepID=A0A6M4HD86_9PROT|nr:MBOAT family protein [Usitatibacter palustris]QJR16503.1 Peptidoglycan O-acetyltransferase [Usitatibacter palustris]
MLFTDPLFLFYFLPASLLLLRVAGWGGRFTAVAKLAIIVATLVFYAYGNWLWPLLFIAVVSGTYGFALIAVRSDRPGVRRAAVAGAVVYALAFLALFKYLNWLATLVPALKGLQAALSPYFGSGGTIELPPGISFYVFEALSFSIDAYRGRITRPVRPLDYLTFLAMFPRFIAGPIVRYPDMHAQFAAWDGPRLAHGLSVFALGFAIKSLFADQFAVFVPYGFAVARPDFLQAWTGALAYTFQLYFDFWGYSLMATGLGLCLGFRFPDNFRSPYRAVGFADFWRRWHITLSQWLRDYLYVSLGGNRCAPWRVQLNVFLTMVIGGLWHGASFTFVAWGAYHGALLVVERWVGESRLERVPVLARQAGTFLLVVIGWVFFRSDTFSQAAGVLAGMTGFNGFASQFTPLLAQKHLPSVLLVVVALLFFWRLEPRVVGAEPMAGRAFAARTQWLLFAAFVFAVLVSMSSREIPFLYFQF